MDKAPKQYRGASIRDQFSFHTRLPNGIAIGIRIPANVLKALIVELAAREAMPGELADGLILACGLEEK